MGVWIDEDGRIVRPAEPAWTSTRSDVFGGKPLAIDGEAYVAALRDWVANCDKSAFVLSDQEEVRFDILFTMVPPGVRRMFTAVSSIAFVILLLISLHASWNYVAFMKSEHTAYLHLRLDLMYSVYVIFALACIVKQAYIAWRAIIGAPPVDAGAANTPDSQARAP